MFKQTDRTWASCLRTLRRDKILTSRKNIVNDNNFSSGGLRRGAVSVAMVTQLLLAGVTAGWGIHRYQVIQDEKTPPQPVLKPKRYEPRYDRPEIVSDEQLQRVLLKLQPRLRGGKPQIDHVDHALRFWGVEAKFTDQDSLSGEELRRLLLDHRSFAGAWGQKTKPFLLPQTRDDVELLSFRTKSGAATASHVDHTLAALAECGTPLDYPVLTPKGELPLRAAFDQTFREFSLNQVEYEWSSLVFLHYLPHAASWFTTEGQRVTWDLLADRMMRQRLAHGVCYGQHRLHALALLLIADEEHHWLSAETRQRIITHLKDITHRLVAAQHDDGYWDERWPGDESDGPQAEHVGPLGAMGNRLLVTGHTLEWWAFAPAEVLPPEEKLSLAAQWLIHTIDDLSESEVRRYYTFLTHAGRSLALWRSRRPADVVTGLSHVGTASN